MVHEKTLAVVCPDVVADDGVTSDVAALIRFPDRGNCTIRAVGCDDHFVPGQGKPVVTDRTEHLSSPLKVRKIQVNDISILAEDYRLMTGR
jgi:hypothetical protein